MLQESYSFTISFREEYQLLHSRNCLDNMLDLQLSRGLNFSQANASRYNQKNGFSNPAATEQIQELQLGSRDP